MILFTLLLGILIALILYFLIGTYNESYWKKRGVSFYKKNKFVGPWWQFLIGDRALFEIFHDIYKSHRKEPAIGLGNFLSPTLYVIDAQNIQHVLHTDFQSFNHRGLEISRKDILADNVLFMNGARWRLMRQSMSPLFTANKLRNMYQIIDKSAQDFVVYLKKNPTTLKSDMFETLNCFCSAAVGAAVFGITTESIFDSPFLEMATKAQAPTTGNILQFVIGNLIPSSIEALQLKFFGDYEKFFIGAIKEVIQQREQNYTKQHDFADICVSLKKNGILKDPETGYEIKPTDEILAAQAFFFYIAGVEPTTTSLFSTLTLLGKHPEILQKVHDEIDETFSKCNGKLSYDIVNEMEYTDKVLNEALRLFPPIGFLTRKCVRDTVLPVGNIKIAKGTKVFTPLYEVHHDPVYYENPEDFNPERFTQALKTNDVTYMPFGMGPRLCIGMRYARLQAKAGLVHLLRHFTVKTESSSNNPKGYGYAKQIIQVRLADVNAVLEPRCFEH